MRTSSGWRTSSPPEDEDTDDAEHKKDQKCLYQVLREQSKDEWMRSWTILQSGQSSA